MSWPAAQFRSRAIHEQRQFAPTPLAARSASNTASRRRSASNGVSPGKISDDGRPAGPTAVAWIDSGLLGSTMTVATVGAVTSDSEFAAIGKPAGFAPAAIGNGGISTASAWIEASAAAVAASRRASVFGDRRVCALNHRRNASSETATPIFPRPSRIARSVAPSRRIFSSSARWASSCEVLGFFGRRDDATNWASVGPELDGVELSGGVVVGKWRGIYSLRFRCAMGALWAQSRPRGLDVGVLTYGFLFFYLKNFSSVGLFPLRNWLCARFAELIKNSLGETGSWMRFGGVVFVESISRREITVRFLVSVGGRSC